MSAHTNGSDNPASQIVSNTRSNDLYAWTGHGSGSTASTVNGLNQLTAVGGVTLTHDSKGNMTFDGVRSYGYSSQNFLTSATGGVTLSYDPLGRLYQLGGTRFLYDGDALIGEYDGAGAIVARYVHGDGVDEPLLSYQAGARHNFHADERGSIIAISNDAGNVTAINAYDEYGRPQGGSVTRRFGYTGQTWLPEIGLYYYKARMYHPGLGRFMQTDPIGYQGGMNLYNYVGSDPVNFTDPTGLAETIVVVGRRECPDHTDEVNRVPGKLYCEVKGVYGGSQSPTSPTETSGCRAREFRSRPECGGEEQPIIRNDLKKYNKKVNYCGGTGGSRLPNNIGGLSYNEACYLHDICYSSSGISKDKCDRDFAKNIALLIFAKGQSKMSIQILSVAAITVAVYGYIIVWRAGDPYYVQK